MHEATPAVCDADHTSRGSALPWYGRLTRTLDGDGYVPAGTPVRVNFYSLGNRLAITRNLRREIGWTHVVTADLVERDDGLAPRAQA